ncbi:GNAT family N-acetyltransferase [Omnitrophica bacterium]|nr:GNAT family N-acetyltransferase [Candidatus Omnitrophota bacterium]
MKRTKKAIMKIEGRSIVLRLVDIKDAQFILNLRLDKKLNKFISKTNTSLASQIRWLEDYKKREADKQEYYFIVESKEQQKYGTIRLYDFMNDSYCWGSWIIKKGAPSRAAIESVLLAHQFGFYTLGFRRSRCNVRKTNKKVTAFYLRLGFKSVNSDKFNYYLELSMDIFEETQKRYKKYLVNKNHVY